MFRAVPLLVGLVAVACSSSTFDGQVYRSGELAFRVGPVPGSWQQIEADSTLLAFRDRGGGATVAVNGRCGKDGDDVPLESLTHHLFLHFTERQIKSQDKLGLDGRDALKTVLLAKLDGVPKHFTVVVLKKDGCVYDFLRIGHDASGVEGFERFVQGFSTTAS
ncbi:MAG: hypothetical protein HYZ29_09380 [Myxococcales bacterium]|nr:hypothetical protein [Myxococcales bacterium]